MVVNVASASLLFSWSFDRLRMTELGKVAFATPATGLHRANATGMTRKSDDSIRFDQRSLDLSRSEVSGRPETSAAFYTLPQIETSSPSSAMAAALTNRPFFAAALSGA
jgi:hypothetical protein